MGFFAQEQEKEEKREEMKLGGGFGDVPAKLCDNTKRAHEQVVLLNSEFMSDQAEQGNQIAGTRKTKSKIDKN
ncbi:hypothetical protein TWF481_002063 [Arthrobotrys musiformis]|uniref:Uncharacterized protein n=1 Tax=Arthrobotrys musiformis TaxID=47236 RepID=A0AAV9VS38_9PEZI